MTHHGSPCWYELTSADIDATVAFYGPIFGWDFVDSGMQGFEYRLARAGADMVAGVYAPQQGEPEAWLVYFAVDSADATAAKVLALGGRQFMAPTDIPNVGRFAVLADPQGAVFGILQPLPGDRGAAFHQQKAGHGNWHELMVADPVAALAFYGQVFGWAEDGRMPMGEMGDYHLIGWQGTQIGGAMRLPGPDVPPHWLPYFGREGVVAGVAEVTAAGGRVQMGPKDVPGGAQIAICQDVRGAWFAMVGPK